VHLLPSDGRTQWYAKNGLESGGESPVVGEVPIQDGTLPLKAATMDAYRVALSSVPDRWAPANRSW
jgi:hypothetical protein